jgi:Flp pilus assembly protein TadD
MNQQIRVRPYRRFSLLSVAGLLLCTGCTWQSLQAERARTRLVQGETAMAQRDFEAALAEFQEAVELAPELPEAHFNLGVAYKETGNLDEAANSLQEAVRLDPDNVEPVFELGEVYRLLNKMTQAIRAYVIACELDPLRFDLRYRLAAAYHETGELSLAVEQYETRHRARATRMPMSAATSAPPSWPRARTTRPSARIRTRSSATTVSRSSS